MTDLDFNTEDLDRKNPSFDIVLSDLHKYRGGVPNATIFYGLSGMLPDQTSKLKTIWSELEPESRRKLMKSIVEVSETNFELDYDALGWFALGDADPLVRQSAIEVLWENETTTLMHRLIKVVSQDTITSVRAEAVKALGRFILKGELGEFPEQEAINAKKCVIALLENEKEDVEVRRRALEAIANCGHDIVPSAIKNAYTSADRLMRISAVFAMGRTCDDSWKGVILNEITNPDEEMRYEAARASGELEIVEAVPHLDVLAHEEDREIKEASIWALGEIGGKESMRILQELLDDAQDADDFDFMDAIEDAIGNASLTMGDMFIFDIDDVEFDD